MAGVATSAVFAITALGGIKVRPLFGLVGETCAEDGNLCHWLRPEVITSSVTSRGWALVFTFVSLLLCNEVEP